MTKKKKRNLPEHDEVNTGKFEALSLASLTC
jgi:hypothetical protein